MAKGAKGTKVIKEWYLCPKCGKKILMYDIKEAASKGLYIKCKQCKREIEIKIH